MGWFGDFFSGASSFVSSVVSTVSSGFRTVVNTCGKALSWLADKAEKVYETGKKIWNTVKPYITAARKVLLVAANFLPPWLKVLALQAEKVFVYLDNLENQSWVIKIKDIIEKGITKLKKAKEAIVSEQEERELENERRELQKAETLILKNPGNEEELENIRVHLLINDYLQVHARLNRVLKEDKISNFEHYLRFCAAQKLMDKYESKMCNIDTLSDIDKDIFDIVRLSKMLLVNPEAMSEEDAYLLDALTLRLFKKPILPFVFQEIIKSWDIKYEELSKQWTDLNKSFAKDKVLFKRLDIAKKSEPLEPEEHILHTNLSKELPGVQRKLDNLEADCREKRNYVYAAEGLLQLLEKDEETLINEGKDYLLERGEEVGQLLIKCSQQELSWTTLSDEEQSLIIDFANIFEEDCKKRASELVEVAA